MRFFLLLSVLVSNTALADVTHDINILHMATLCEKVMHSELISSRVLNADKLAAEEVYRRVFESIKKKYDEEDVMKIWKEAFASATALTIQGEKSDEEMKVSYLGALGTCREWNESTLAYLEP